MTDPAPSTRSTDSEGAEAPDLRAIAGITELQRIRLAQNGYRIVRTAPPSAPDPGRRAIDRMLRAADTDTRLWMEQILAEEGAAPDPEADAFYLGYQRGWAERGMAAPDPEGLPSVEALAEALRDHCHDSADEGVPLLLRHDHLSHLVRDDCAAAILARLSPVEPTDKAEPFVADIRSHFMDGLSETEYEAMGRIIQARLNYRVAKDRGDAQ